MFSFGDNCVYKGHVLSHEHIFYVHLYICYVYTFILHYAFGHVQFSIYNIGYISRSPIPIIVFSFGDNCVYKGHILSHEDMFYVHLYICYVYTFILHHAFGHVQFSIYIIFDIYQRAPIPWLCLVLGIIVFIKVISCHINLWYVHFVDICYEHTYILRHAFGHVQFSIYNIGYISRNPISIIVLSVWGKHIFKGHIFSYKHIICTLTVYYLLCTPIYTATCMLSFNL